jgi:hypothetical protein
MAHAYRQLRRARTIAALALLTLSFRSPATFGQRPLEDSATLLEGGASSRSEADAAIEQLRLSFEAHQSVPTARLLAIVSDPGQRAAVRSGVLEVLLDQPDPEILLDVVSHVAQWPTGGEVGSGTSDSNTQTQQALVYIVLRRLPDHPALADVAPTTPFQELLGNALDSSPLLDDPGPPLLTLLARAPMREEARERLATRTILRAHASNFLGEEFVFAVQKPENIRAIRSALAESPNDVGFHNGAASALAMLGDPFAAAELRRRASELAPRRDDPWFGNLIRKLEYDAGFAEAASSPKFILRYLAEDADPRDTTGLCAALRVAARFGLTREEVRPAIRSLPDRARSVAARLSDKPRFQESLALMSLVPVRDTAIELGFLDSTDLPDVEAYAREQAKHAPMP